jgi:hypothetical protein
MKLEKILDRLNSFEKNSFLKIIDSIIADNPKNEKEIDKILIDASRDLKNMDIINIAKVFHLLELEFTDYLKNIFLITSSQIDIISDIIIRDGNSIMKQDWFAKLYFKEIASLQKKLVEFKSEIENEKSEITECRKRDYKIYKACLSTAYCNDDKNNLERKITYDEQTIINTLAKQLGLSQEDLKLMKYQILPIEKKPIEEVINELKSIGIAFYSKKTNTVYIPDEIVRIIRKIRGKEIADKYFRRILKLLKPGQINSISRKHGIERTLNNDEKIKEIINKGISFRGVLIDDIHKDGTTLTDKKKFINELCDKYLNISPALKGIVIEEKVDNLILYFENIERDEKVGISLDGYEKLISELGGVFPEINDIIKNAFELQEENVLKSAYLLDYNIKPRDILELLVDSELIHFCEVQQIKTRGDIIINILEAYKDAENLYFENYENIGYRNYSLLKENGLNIKEAEIGLKFEEITKKIFEKLGFNVDEDLRKKINTKNDKADIVLNIGNNDIIIVECKTVKESGYNKFSSVSRQLKSYSKIACQNNYNVIKSLLVAPDFSDDFIKECGLEYELNLSLITASSLINILEGFKVSKLKTFPHNLLMRDVLIQESRVLKAIER